VQKETPDSTHLINLVKDTLGDLTEMKNGRLASQKYLDSLADY